MWLFTRYGFYSVVCARENAKSRVVDPERLMVRGRNVEHLKNLINRFPQLTNCEILQTKNTDYCCRIFVPKAVWTEVMKELTLDLDYDNFKNEVQDVNYHDTLSDVWSIMYKYQFNET